MIYFLLTFLLLLNIWIVHTVLSIWYGDRTPSHPISYWYEDIPREDQEWDPRETKLTFGIDIEDTKK